MLDPSPGKRLAERALSAAPLLGLGLVVVVFYCVQAWLRKTPWVFADELEWSQLSRSIAATGHAARRGQPIWFKSLYAFLIAPAWWIHSTAAAYAAIKYVNVIVMCLAAVPTYLMSRALVTKRAAMAVALLTISIPAMSYTSAIVPESLAYTWFATEAWLAVRALTAPSKRTFAPPVVLAALAPLVRKEFVALPASLVVAAALVWVARDGDPAASLRRRWKRTAVAVAAVVVVGVLFNWLVVEHVQSYQASQYLNRHTFANGALAAGALAIGMGLLPVIGGITALWLPERRVEPGYRAFAVYLATSLLTLVIYTAGKATYLASAQPALIEERNLFYLAPLLLLGTAITIGARRIDWRLVAVATALVLVTVWSGKLIVGAPYYEAPGLALETFGNRHFFWDIHDFHRVFLVLAAVSILLLALRHRRAVPALAVVLLGAWMIGGELYAARANVQDANLYALRLPPPRDWVDQATHGGAVTFLGQSITDANQLWLTEFWNRSLHHVASLNGFAPGPGPGIAPGLANAGGVLSDYTGDPYTLAQKGINLQEPVVASRDDLTLYHTVGSWRLLDEEYGVYTDGWAPAHSAYTYFAPGGPGVLTIHLSREAFTGKAPPGRVTLRIGTVKLDHNGVPEVDRLLAIRHRVVADGKVVTVDVHVPLTPVTVDITSTTFQPPSDPRQVGVQVGFEFVRD